MVQWIKELVAFLLFSGLILMLVPETGLRQFLRFVVGLLLIALMLQPLIGTGVLISSNRITLGMKELWNNLRATNHKPVKIECLQMRSERLVEKGSGVVREYMENQTNRQLGALLSLFVGVDGAQVVTQVSPQGQLERVLVQLHVTQDAVAAEESALFYSTEAEEEDSSVPLVQPVLVTEQNQVPGVSCDPYLEKLVTRVRTWVADFYGIDTESVTVTTL